MKIASMLVLIPLSLMTVSAIANVQQSTGKEKCTVIDSIAKKKSTTSACTYTSDVGGGNGYGVDEAEYKLKNGKKYRTVNDASYETVDDDGRILDMKYDISLNDKPAKIIYLNNKTFKAYSEKAVDTLRDKESAELKSILLCFSEIKTKDTAFCTPLPIY